MLKKIFSIIILLQLFFADVVFTQNQNSSEEEAIKQVIMNETKNWFNVDYEGWAKNWAHEKYVLNMFAGYGSPNSNLSWDSVKTAAKDFFNEYREPFNIDVSWSDWNIRVFNDCSWASYLQTSIYEENTQFPNKDREIRFLEKKDGMWKIVFVGSINLSFYNSSSATEYNLNDAGYILLEERKFSEAIKIFKLNTELYPKSSNVYDSLGEAYMKNGDKELAIQNYQKSLELDPNNEKAKEMLKKLAEN
jgi:tetratricopeptide (TPR) repeat protein